MLSGLTEKFNWQWYYYFLTNEGIDYLREVLHLPLNDDAHRNIFTLRWKIDGRQNLDISVMKKGSRVVQNPWIATSYICQQICAFRTLISLYVVEVVALRTTV